MDWKTDIQATGNRVLEIWNARVNEAMKDHDDLRIFVMIRNVDTLEFTLLEHEATRFIPANYYWELGKKGNLHGYCCTTKEHKFTWQHSGGQFTMMEKVPNAVYRFKINRAVPMIPEHQVLATINFDSSWITPMLANGLTDNEDKSCASSV